MLFDFAEIQSNFHSSSSPKQVLCYLISIDLVWLHDIFCPHLTKMCSYMQEAMKADHFYYPGLFSCGAIAAGLFSFLLELLLPRKYMWKNQKKVPSMHIPIMHKIYISYTIALLPFLVNFSIYHLRCVILEHPNTEKQPLQTSEKILNRKKCACYFFPS